MPRFSDFSAYIRRQLLRRRWRIPRVIREARIDVAFAAAADPEVTEPAHQPEMVVDLNHVCELLRLLPPPQAPRDQIAKPKDAVTEDVVSKNVSADDAPIDDAAAGDAAAKGPSTTGSGIEVAGTGDGAAGNAPIHYAAANNSATENEATNGSVINNGTIHDAATHNTPTANATTQDAAINNLVPFARPVVTSDATPMSQQPASFNWSARAAVPVVSGGRWLTNVDTIIQTRMFAQRTARSAQMAGDMVDGRLHLVYFTDGSCGRIPFQYQPSTGGYAVVFKIPGTDAAGWSGKRFNMISCFEAQQAEMTGQVEALAMAVTYLDQHDLFDAVIQIFADSEASITSIRRGINAEWYTGGFVKDIVRPILMRLSQLSERLDQRRSRVQIHWVKRSSNGKNIEADRLAAEARMDGDVPFPDRSTATSGLDEEVESLAERWLEEKDKEKEKVLCWDHVTFTQEMIGRVLVLRRIKAGPEWTMELELELRKENLVGWRI